MDTIVLLDFCNKFSWVNCTKLSPGGSKLVEEVTEGREQRLRLVRLVPVGQNVLTEWLAEVQGLHDGVHVARVAELRSNAEVSLRFSQCRIWCGTYVAEPKVVLGGGQTLPQRPLKMRHLSSLKGTENRCY